ncbi:MAG: ABC transporter ATP-binding protein [Planctomycetota bacterium]
MIEVQHLSKEYSIGPVLSDVSFKVEPGEVCGLIGPNGAGKTTLLRILATILHPSGGSVSMCDIDLREDAQEIRRRIGYMPDRFSTYEELRVDSFLEFFASIYEIPEAQVSSVTQDILKLVDLAPLRHSLIENLSLGVRQRLSLARALLHNPEVLLLDEPVSGLDPRARVEMRALLKELGDMGKTVLMSSHVLTDMVDVCDRFLVLEQGRVVFHGTLAELEARVADRRVIRINAAPRNGELADFLRSYRWASSIQNGGEDVRVELGAEAPDLAKISQQLFDAGFALSRFTEEPFDLEEGFLRLTRGVVS